ncbi:MAG: ATPase [Alloprevotella sp.]|nr:ATPase [Alloprevotella sp.]
MSNDIKFYQREEAFQRIKEIQEAAHQTAQMTMVTGRHRIGKTQFILEATKGAKTLYFYIARKAESLLCREFEREARSKLNLPQMGDVDDFRTLMKHLMAASKEETFNVVIDEFHEWATINQKVFADLQGLWDRNHDRSHICLFLMGTDGAQCTKLFDGKHAPLEGRVTSWVKLEPYTTTTLREVLAANKPDYTAEDLMTLYCFTGGVPKYVDILMRNKLFKADDIIDFTCQDNSPFINEGKTLLIEDFGKEYTIYFSILTCIANNITSRSLIEEYIQKEIGGYLTRLETDFHLIRKLTPLFSRSGSKNVRYTISDNFLRFWFRFIYRYAQLVETARFGELRSIIRQDFDTFRTESLSSYFEQQLRESGEYPVIGGWWDNRCEEGLEIVALNEATKRCLVVGVSPDKANVNIDAMREQIEQLQELFGEYEVEYRACGMEDI